MIFATVLTILIVGQQGYTGGINGITDLRTLLGWDIRTDGAKYILYFVCCFLLLGTMFLSRFVAESLRLAPERPRRIEVFPYGVASPVDAPVAERGEHEPLRILYAGQLTQRKGLAYLFEALSRF